MEGSLLVELWRCGASATSQPPRSPRYASLAWQEQSPRARQQQQSREQPPAPAHPPMPTDGGRGAGIPPPRKHPQPGREVAGEHPWASKSRVPGGATRAVDEGRAGFGMPGAVGARDDRSSMRAPVGAYQPLRRKA
ncbi:hypothetical protein B2J93_5282 [Marssonina coronariae]|uniref:Uncharacterized protein n=1 Tax=Diplocarpon coronariae TaxID=2795749 RepID=A0A218YSF8_9HELO|nr:hypothetical protein B2J93_5282 [Marssonina coronariae]